MFSWLRRKPLSPKRQVEISRVEERLRRARELRDAGRAPEAESELKVALVEAPHARVYFELGVVLQMQNRLEEAEASYRSAIAAEPSDADAHNCLGVVLHARRRENESLAAHERALSLRPDFVEARNNAAVALQGLGRPADALAHYERALVLSPAHPGLQFNSARTLEMLARDGEAEERYRKAIELAPDLAMAHSGLGALLRRTGRTEEAMEEFARAAQLQPDLDQARLGVAYCLIELGLFDRALEELNSYLEMRPQDAGALLQHGRVLEQLGRLPQARESYVRALQLAPASAEGHMRLGTLQRHSGDYEGYISNLRRAVELQPDYAPAWTGLLLGLNYAEGLSPGEIFAPHREFGVRFAPSAAPPGHLNTREPGRRLRVGYVSGDFRSHPVAQFVEPVIERHDRRAFEVFCYHAINRSDAVTVRIKSHADGWRDVFSLSDEALAELIRGDGIDVLIDLSGHTAHNRLLAFARKPAPVQATWLGYLNTTGLAAMDWRITDAHAAPVGLLDAYHTERLVRLPDCQWCYQAPADACEVSPRSAAARGAVTFGAFTNPAKITASTISLWSRLLARLPGSKLLAVGQGLDSIADDFRARFVSHGIDAERIEAKGFQSFPDYLASHGEVDVMLDTFPYAGGTTSCHSLWMGVPVVTLAGNTPASRGGASLLHVVGLPELVAEHPEDYLRIAQSLAGDPAKLAELRAGLRNRMRASPLMDLERFARGLEDAYRAMWRSWCERPG